MGVFTHRGGGDIKKEIANKVNISKTIVGKGCIELTEVENKDVVCMYLYLVCKALLPVENAE